MNYCLFKDVLLMWHTHMVSPWKYYEDIARLYGTNSPLLLEDFPLYMVNPNLSISVGYECRSFSFFLPPMYQFSRPYQVSTSSDPPYLSTITFNGNDEVLWNTVVTEGISPYNLTDKDLKVTIKCPWCANINSYWRLVFTFSNLTGRKSCIF